MKLYNESCKCNMWLDDEWLSRWGYNKYRKYGSENVMNRANNMIGGK